MDSQETSAPQKPRKRRGPAPTGKGVPINLRVHPNVVAALDEWISNQPGFMPTRQQAIRYLIEKGIGYKKPVKKSRVGRHDAE